MDGIIKDRNRKDVTEVEEVKRCKNTEKNYFKKVLITQIAMMIW